MNNFMKYNFDIQDIVIACYVARGNGTPIHKNRPSHGIVFNTGGVTNYIFDETKIISTHENDILYLPKGSNYTVNLQGEGEDGCYAINFQLFNEISFNPFKFRTKNQKSFIGLFKNTEQAWRLKKSGFEMKCKALLYNILFDLKKEYEAGYISKNKTRLISPAIDYIHTEYTNDNIDISYIADLCHISEAYFRRIFFKSFGISPIKYINNLKHERTDFCTLVANSALPSFTSDMTSEKETSACVIIPISDIEANPTFYCVINGKDKSKFQALLKHLE